MAGLDDEPTWDQAPREAAPPVPPVPPWPRVTDGPLGPQTPTVARPWGVAAAATPPDWARAAAPAAPPRPVAARRRPRRGGLIALVGVLLVALGAGTAAAWPTLSRLVSGPFGSSGASGAPGAAGGSPSAAAGSFADGARQAWTFDLDREYPGVGATFPFGPNLDDASSNFRFGPVAAHGVWLVPVTFTGGAELVGLDAASGRKLWALRESVDTCQPGPRDGTAFCVTRPPQVGDRLSRLLLIDLSTGAAQEKQRYGGYAYLDVADDTVVVAAETPSGLVAEGFDGQGARRWSTPLSGGEHAMLADILIPLRTVDGLAGVMSMGGDVVVDAATGEQLLRGDSLDIGPGRRVLVRAGTKTSGPGTGLTQLTGYRATTMDAQGRWGLFRDAAAGPQWCEGAKPDACRDLGLGAGASVETPLVSSPDAAYAEVVSNSWRRLALVDVTSGAVHRSAPLEGASQVVTPGPAIAARAADGTLTLLDALSGDSAGSARLSGWHLVTGEPGRLALARTGKDRADSSSSTALTVFVPATAAGSGITLLGAAPATAPAAGPAGLPQCPGGTIRLAFTVFDDGDWVLVCGIDAATPTAWRSRLGGQEQSSDRVSVQPASDGTGGPGGYTAALPEGGSAWLSSAPAMAGRSDGSGHLGYSRAASGQIWFVWLGGATPQPSQGSYGVPVPAASAADQVRYLSQLLEQSAATRSSLETSVTSIRECRRGAGGDYTPDIAGIDAATRNRQQLLTALQTAPVDQIPGGTALVDQLHEALALSLQTDQWYAAWARSSTASGCAPLGEGGGLALSTATGKAKDAFVATWNSRIAPAYGVAPTARAKI